MSDTADPHLRDRQVNTIPNDRSAVALTFDDGPDPEVMPRLLDVLRDRQARVTFYILGSNLQKHPDIARRALDEGHEIANHTLTHPHLGNCDIETIQHEIAGAQQLIQDTLGLTPTTFRAPYGEMCEDAFTVIQGLGLPAILTNRGSLDWEHQTPPEIIRARTGSIAEPGDIMLYHSWSTATLQALPDILSDLTDRGLQALPACELLKDA